MGGGFLDIILFALLAAFLVYRLGSVLGKRTGHESRTPDGFGDAGKQHDAAPESAKDNVVSLPDRSGDEDGVTSTGPAAAGLTQIKVADPAFSEKSFLEGAQSAFEMVVSAFAAGDGKTLNMLLSPEVYENFAQAIRDREIANQSLETTLVAIRSAEIIEAEMKGREALVTVRFVSEQINVTRDMSGELVEGDPNVVVEVTDIWTFARNTRATDPNWTLVATRSPS